MSYASSPKDVATLGQAGEVTGRVVVGKIPEEVRPTGPTRLEEDEVRGSAEVRVMGRVIKTFICHFFYPKLR